MATREKPTPDDRVAEYVDSPRMIYRIRQGKQLTARSAERVRRGRSATCYKKA
ncbi:MAG: hypothetical protein WD669_08540 [Pirellulales bacterium]